MPRQQADVAIIGGGIVGLASAYNFVKRFPNRRVLILEKEELLVGMFWPQTLE